jgi:signal transduction histidine kinase
MASMLELPLSEMRRTIGLDDADVANVRELAAVITPNIPEVVEEFYTRLLDSPGARAILTGGDDQMARLRATLTAWLEELFIAEFDQSYYDRRRNSGSTHVRIGLPQHYMFTGMELLRQGLERRIRGSNISDCEIKVNSLQKVLALDLAIMLESYKLSYGEQIRKVERTAVEEKLTRAEHLAEIGQLAASLAHEIKNPLAGISGAIQIIRDSMAHDDPHRTIVTEILGQIRRLDATVKDLLQYARPTPPAARKIGVDAIVRRVLTVLQKEPALQDITVHYTTPPDDPHMFADDRQVEQLLINLIINAAHASQNGSSIHLVVRNFLDDVQITIQDEGEGMTHDTLHRAFEPFFTTKAKGTGLGLSICRRIVEVHGGRIKVNSQLGNGTSVSITIPQNAATKTKEPV